MADLREALLAKIRLEAAKAKDLSLGCSITGTIAQISVLSDQAQAAQGVLPRDEEFGRIVREILNDAIGDTSHNLIERCKCRGTP